MIKIAPEQGRAGAVKPATANINLALVIRAINTLAPARVTPVVPAPPAAENTPLALAHHLIRGHQGLVLAPQLINTPAPAQATRVAPVQPAMVNIKVAPAHHLTLGAMGLVQY